MPSRALWLALATVCVASVTSFSLNAQVVPESVPVSESTPVPIPVPQATDVAIDHFGAVESHFDRMIHYSLDRYGRTRSGMWVSSIDIHSNELPDEGGADETFLNGSQIYWDQPMLLAAYEVGRRSGCKCYNDSASSYVRSYMHQCRNELGNGFDLSVGRYFDVRRDRVLNIPRHQVGAFSHTPAWELFWQHDSAATENAIVDFADAQLSTAQVPLVQTAIAIESMCWLAREKQELDGNLVRTASKIANAITRRDTSGIGKLKSNSADVMRWVLALDRCADWTQKESFRRLIAAILKVDAASRMDERHRLQAALIRHEVLLREVKRQRLSSDSIDLTAMRNNVAVVLGLLAKRADVGGIGKEQLNARDIGQRIHFYVTASDVLSRPKLKEFAVDLANDAVDRLYVPRTGMFRSRVSVDGKNRDRCDAADGAGWLFLALLELDGGSDPIESSALGW